MDELNGILEQSHDRFHRSEFGEHFLKWPDSFTLSAHKRKKNQQRQQSVEDRLVDLSAVSSGVVLDDILAEVERAYIGKALQEAGGKKEKAAKLLGINLRSLRYRMDKLDIGK